jgi:hypothetical protein
VCWLRIRTIFRTFIRWQVFAPMLGATACTAGILRLMGAPILTGLSNRVLIVACTIVGLYAIVVAINEGRQIYRRSMAKTLLTRLFNEGRTFTTDFSKPLSQEDSQSARDWVDRVNKCLRSYLDESYAMRFNVQVHFIMKDNSMAIGEIQQRTEKLEEFLQELN